MGSGADRTLSKALAGGQGMQGSSWQSRWPHICVQIKWKEQLGSRQIMQPRIPVWGNKASKPLTEKKSVGVEAAGETASLTGEFV